MDAEQELRDEYEARYGDPRRCSEHGYATSSPDGMFDAPCPACEDEAEQDADEAEEERRAALTPEERAAEDAELAEWRARRELVESIVDDDSPF